MGIALSTYRYLGDGVTRFKTERGCNANFVLGGVLIVHLFVGVDPNVAVAYGAVNMIYSGKKKQRCYDLRP